MTVKKHQHRLQLATFKEKTLDFDSASRLGLLLHFTFRREIIKELSVREEAG
jgi:hypothetical protein